MRRREREEEVTGKREVGNLKLQNFVDKLSQQWLIRSALNAPNLSHSHWTKIARIKIDAALNEINIVRQQC